MPDISLVIPTLPIANLKWFPCDWTTFAAFHIRYPTASEEANFHGATTTFLTLSSTSATMLRRYIPKTLKRVQRGFHSSSVANRVAATSPVKAQEVQVSTRALRGIGWGVRLTCFLHRTGRRRGSTHFSSMNTMPS